jgi:hypothetical protein
VFGGFAQKVALLSRCCAQNSSQTSQLTRQSRSEAIWQCQVPGPKPTGLSRCGRPGALSGDAGDSPRTLGDYCAFSATGRTDLHRPSEAHGCNGRARPRCRAAPLLPMIGQLRARALANFAPHNRKPPEPHCRPSVAIRPRASSRARRKSMEKSMSAKQLKEFASTKRKGKPEHAAK